MRIARAIVVGLHLCLFVACAMALRMIADGVSQHVYDRTGPLGLLGIAGTLLAGMFALLAGLSSWRQRASGRTWLLWTDAILAFLSALTIIQVGLADVAWLVAVAILAGLSLEAVLFVPPPPAAVPADELDAEVDDTVESAGGGGADLRLGPAADDLDPSIEGDAPAIR